MEDDKVILGYARKSPQLRVRYETEYVKGHEVGQIYGLMDGVGLTVNPAKS